MQLCPVQMGAAPQMNQALAFQRPLTLAIFSATDEALRVLLVQRPAREDEPFPGQWALPGGFVDVH
jgi:8-oxo-dGTP diphosphatase